MMRLLTVCPFRKYDATPAAILQPPKTMGMAFAMQGVRQDKSALTCGKDERDGEEINGLTARTH